MAVTEPPWQSYKKKLNELQHRVKIYHHPYKLVTLVLTLVILKIKVCLKFRVKHVNCAPAELRFINSQQYCMHYKGVRLLLVLCSTGSRACLLLRGATEGGGT